MKRSCGVEPEDIKRYYYTVTEADVAAFKGTKVHRVCSTFALAREVEWATRQFVLDIKEEDEEGIGTRLEIAHKGPIFVGDTIAIEAILKKFEGDELICHFKVRVNRRTVAEGITGQKIFKKEYLNTIFDDFQRKK